MKKPIAMLMIYLKAILTVLQPEELKWLKKYNKTPGNHKYTVRERILVETLVSIRETELASKKAKLDAEIADTSMSFLDKTGWDHQVAYAHEHQYDLAALKYAEKCARLMELRMQQGGILQEVARDAMVEAYTDDVLLTGDIMSRAFTFLVKFWKYGEELNSCIRIRTDEEMMEEIIC